LQNFQKKFIVFNFESYELRLEDIQ